MRYKAKNVSTFVTLLCNKLMFLMKNKLVLLITGCFILLFSSCLGSGNDYNYEIPKDSQITSFSLSSDSVPELSEVRFTIDQVEGLIFNLDSMPYGTEIIDKVICTATFATGTLAVQVIQEAIGDTIDWNGQDSLNFSKPVKFITTAYDGVTKKTYKAWINIHQVVPDSMVWDLYANNVLDENIQEEKVVPFVLNGDSVHFMYIQPKGSNPNYELYYSSFGDMKSWKKLSLSGLPASGLVLSQITEYEHVLYVISQNGTLYQSVDGQSWTVITGAPVIKALMGCVNPVANQASALAAIVSESDGLYFASMNKDMEWNVGNEIPYNFPIWGFGSASYSVAYRERLMVIAGKDSRNVLTNAAWGTMDGLGWALLTDAESSYFETREGVMLTKYDSKLFMIGGITSSGKASKEIYTSEDNGVTWNLQDTLIVLPNTYGARGYASIYVDKEQFMYILGGKTSNNSNVLDQIWRGRINRLAFKD